MIDEAAILLCILKQSKDVIKPIFRLGKLWHVQLYKQLLRLGNCLTDAAPVCKDFPGFSTGKWDIKFNQKTGLIGTS